MYFRTTDVTVIVNVPAKEADGGLVQPGENIEANMELLTDVPLEEGMRFTIREGGKTVGTGFVSKIIE